MNLLYSKYLVAILAITSLYDPPIWQVEAAHGSPKTCYECSEKYPKNYFCWFKGKHDDPWRGTCCKEGNNSPYCQKKSYNRCSKSFEEMGPMYY